VFWGVWLLLALGAAWGQVADNYVLGPGDKLAIVVFDHPELSLEAVIRPDGLITHPFLGPMQVSGQTPAQLAALVTKELKRELRSPLVTVSVLAMAGNLVHVKGGVTVPGDFPTGQPITLARAVALAQGLAPRANQSEAVIISPDGTQRPVDLAAALGPKAPEYLLYPRETLLILPAESKPLTIIGEVGKPGKYFVAAPDDTLLDALLAAGWVTPNADRRHALILRHGDEPQQIDLAPLLAYQAGAVGPRLESGDTIVFPRATNYVTIWGAVTKPGKVLLDPNSETVADALVGAGGLTAVANPDTATLIHLGGATVPVDLQAVLTSPTSPANLQLQGGDTLLVATRRNEIMVLGAVTKPGPYPAPPGLDTRLLDALTLAGGVTPEADLEQVQVLRGGQAASTVSIRSLLLAGDPQNNLELRVGDTVVVPVVRREVLVFGYVGTPGRYEFREGDRVMDIIARAGGFDKSSAAPWKTALIRAKGADADVYLVDMDKVVRGQSLDKNYLVQNSDVIVVPKRTGIDWQQWVGEVLLLGGAVRIFG
jgi:polysaccharide export outer membrane protein